MVDLDTSGEVPGVAVTAARLILATGVWTCLYYLLALVNPKRPWEWHNRTITWLHALIAVCFSGWSIIVQGPNPFTNFGVPPTPLHTFISIMTSGYFFFDLAWCLYFKSEGPVMIAHHIISLAALYIVVCRHTNGTETMICIIGLESTNPLLQHRYFLRETGRYDTWYGRLNDAAFVIVFGLLRILVGTYYVYCFYNSYTIQDFHGKSVIYGLYFVSWIFWYQILRFARRKLRQFSKPSSSMQNRNGIIKKKQG